MTSYFFSHYGRGGAKLIMPRPNVEWQEIKITRNFFLTGWIYFIKDTVSLIYHIRFFLIIFLIILAITNIMISMKFVINKSPLKAIHQQAVNFIFQPEPPKPAPIPPVIAWPELKAKEPRPEPPKPKEKKPLNLEASLNIEKNFVQKQKQAKKHQTRRIIPKSKAKEQLDLKTSLNIEKNFVQESKQIKTRHVRRVALNPAEDNQLIIKDSLNREKDFVPEVKRIKIPNMHRARSLSREKEDLILVASLNEKQDFMQASPETHKATRKHKRNNNIEEFNNYKEIHVQTKDMDFSDFENNSRQITNKQNMTSRSDRGREDIKGVQFAIKGKSLETLKDCGQLETDLKISLAKFVQKKGYIKKCIDRTGKYLFYWPKGRFTVSNFNVIIYPALGRKVTDRCEELNYAINCLKKY